MLFQRPVAGVSLPVHECLEFLNENQNLKERLKQRHLELSFLRSQLSSVESERSALINQIKKQRKSVQGKSAASQCSHETAKQSLSFGVQSSPAVEDKEIQIEQVEPDITSDDKNLLIQRLTKQCDLQKQLLEEQDLLLEHYQQVINSPAVDIGEDLDGLLGRLAENQDAEARRQIIVNIKLRFEALLKRNDIAQQLIEEYERMILQ